MKRARIVTAFALVVTAGCTALINVPDLELGPFPDAGTDGPVIVVTNDSAIPPANDSATPTVDSGSDAALVCGADVDLQTDSANCGVCGHSCQGLSCATGSCQPSTLADGLAGPYELDQDDTFLYFSDYINGEVWRVKKDGTLPGEILVSTDIPNAVGVHIDGTTLYFTSNLGVERCDVSNGATSCTSSRVKIAPNQVPSDDEEGPETITSYQGQLFWADDHHSVFRSLPDGGSRVQLLSNLPGEPFKVAIGAGNLYVTLFHGQGGMVSALVDGTGIKDAGPELSKRDDPYVVADDAGYFWSYVDFTATTGELYSGDQATHTPKSLATSDQAGLAIGVAIDATYIYWIDAGTVDANDDSAGDGRLLRCLRTGCAGAPTVVATGLLGGGPIVVDDKFIYFIENNNEGFGDDSTKARVRRVTKP